VFARRVTEREAHGFCLRKLSSIDPAAASFLANCFPASASGTHGGSEGDYVRADGNRVRLFLTIGSFNRWITCHWTGYRIDVDAISFSNAELRIARWDKYPELNGSMESSIATYTSQAPSPGRFWPLTWCLREASWRTGDLSASNMHIARKCTSRSMRSPLNDFAIEVEFTNPRVTL